MRINALTPAESDVLSCMVYGFDNDDIATIYSIAPKTAEKHRHRIYSKLQIAGDSRCKSTRAALMVLDQFPGQDYDMLVDGRASFVEPLSKREDEVTGLVSQGCSNREIADALCVKEKAVESHMGFIYKKLVLDGGEPRTMLALAYRAMKARHPEG